MLGLGRVYTKTCLKVVILICKRLCSQLLQESRSQVIPGLRYKSEVHVVDNWSLTLNGAKEGTTIRT